jgi:lysophospholipase L1-like esterase
VTGRNNSPIAHLIRGLVVAGAAALALIVPASHAYSQPAAMAGASQVRASAEQSPAALARPSVLSDDEVAPAPIARNDVLNKARCHAPGAVFRLGGTLNRLARRLAAHESVTIVAVGSSSTGGAGASAPAFAYPRRLEMELRKLFPGSDITVINRGVNGETAPQMVARLDRAVLDEDPDLVLWQLGTNSVVRDEKIFPLYHIVRDGVERIKANEADLILIDPQYAPLVVDRMPAAKEMVSLIDRIAQEEHVSVFHRFEVMRHWHDEQAMPFETFMTGDGLHLNDWGYACWARILGEAIAGSVKRAQSVARVNFAIDRMPAQ